MNAAKTFCERPQKLLSAPLSFRPSPLLLGPCRERTHQGDGQPSPQEKTRMHTRNVNVRTAAQESSRKMGGEPQSYLILVAEKKKNSADEWDVMEFNTLTELKKIRRSSPETMNHSYSYALSSGVDKQFRYINVVEADHFKQFVRLIERAGIKI
jgi:hypothetical protein